MIAALKNTPAQMIDPITTAVALLSVNPRTSFGQRVCNAQVHQNLVGSGASECHKDPRENGECFLHITLGVSR